MFLSQGFLLQSLQLQRLESIRQTNTNPLTTGSTSNIIKKQAVSITTLH